MSTATAAYGVFALQKPEHLGRALGATPAQMAGYDLLARTYGVRDLAISALGVLGRSDRTVRTGMALRIAMDLGDSAVLALTTEDPKVRRKVLAVTLGWAALNVAAVVADARNDD